MIRLLLLQFILLFTVSIYSQNNWNEINTIQHQATSMTTDRLGNLYLSNENEIWMYNANGDSIAAFNSKQYGNISHIDATDPYKILVFFSDYNLIIFLDNYLSINGDPIDLQELGFDQVSMACQSREKGFWIYDLIKQKAIHLDKNFKADKQTVNLYQWFGKRIEPTSMIEYNNTLYINEAESGIYVFDHFASYQKKIVLLGLNNMQPSEKKISYFLADQYCNYLFQDFSKKCQSIDLKNVLEMRMEKNNIYIFKANELIIYSTN